MLRIRIVVTCLSLVSGLSNLSAADFEVAEGFDATASVKKGLVQHPISGAIDHRGRLFITESIELNSSRESSIDQPQSVIKRLEDSDSDGVFDTAIVFAEQLNSPQGLVWVDDSLYVLAPPYLWKFPDRNDDGKADGREKIVDGFSIPEEGLSTHGPFLHPNGRLYWTQGRHRFSIPDPDTGQIIQTGTAAHLWFSSISGGDVATFAGGGMDSPSEIDFTDGGEIVGVINQFYGRPRGDSIAHWIYQGAYPRRDQNLALSELPRTGDLLPAVHNFGHSEVTGICRYRSGLLENDWVDQWFTSHFDDARLTRTQLQPNGATFESVGTETVFQIRNATAHLTDVIEDHNGDLLIFDNGTSHLGTSDTPTEGSSKSKGNIYRLSRQGSSYFRPDYPDWDNLTAADVAALLGANESWIQSKAITELAVRGAPAIPELRGLLMQANATDRTRRNAVWTLARMNFSEAADLIYEALKDISPEVRQTACQAMGVTRSWQNVAANQPAERSIELERNRTITGALAKIVRSDSPAVARSAAEALGRMGEFRAIGALLGRLGRVGNDRFLEHSLIYALIEIDDYEATHAGLSSENPDVLNGVLWAIEEMPSSQIEIFDVLPLLESSHSKLRESAIAIATKHPDWDAGLANRFFEWTDELTEHQKLTLNEIVPLMQTSPPVIDYLSSLILSGKQDQVTLGLELLSRSPISELAEDWDKVFFSTLSPDGDSTALSLTLEILFHHPLPRFRSHLESLTASEDLPSSTQEKALEVLSLIPPPAPPVRATPTDPVDKGQ